jgi:hypothetical protein
MAIGFETGRAALALNPRSSFGFTSAAKPITLPKPKPRAMDESLIVSPIRSRQIVQAQ